MATMASKFYYVCAIQYYPDQWLQCRISKQYKLYVMYAAKNIQKYILGGGYLFVYGLVLSTRLKTHNCILESKGNSSNFEILVKFKDYYNCKVI